MNPSHKIKSLDQTLVHCPIFLTAVQKNLVIVSELIGQETRESLLKIFD